MNIISTRDATWQHYALYERYILARHADGDMYPPSQDQFEKFLVHSCTESFFLSCGRMNSSSAFLHVIRWMMVFQRFILFLILMKTAAP